MQCGSQLSLEKRAKLSVLFDARKIFREIANQHGRSHFVSYSYLADPPQNATKHKRKGNRKMTTKHKRRLFRVESSFTKSARTLQSKLSLTIPENKT